MINEQGFDEYRNEIDRLSASARKTSDTICKAATGREKSISREEVKSIVEALAANVDLYGGSAADLACQLYDAIRAEETRRGHYRATPAELYDEILTELYEMLASMYGLDETLLGEYTDKQVKQYARRTIELNANKDKSCKGFQVVPSKKNTCSFCTMQAGRGIIYHHNLKNMQQPYHVHCKCQPIPIFEGLPDWFDSKSYSEKYHAARDAFESGDYSDELKERMDKLKTEDADYGKTQMIMAIMREQNKDAGMK